MVRRANLKTLAGATLIGGVMTAGAISGMGLAQAAPHTPKPFPPDTMNNGNPGVPPKYTGQTANGLVPTWATGTYNPATCTGGACYVPQATTPFFVGTATAANPIAAAPSGTSTTILLGSI